VIAGLLVYCAGLMAMIGCSALYHLSGATPSKALFRRLDHAAIFLMIAGTYTPFALNTIGGFEGFSLLAFVWVCAVCGIILKLSNPGTIERASVAFYLLLGWSGFAMANHLLSAVPTRTLLLLAAGGILYTVGVVFYLSERLPYHKAIWHGFVLSAAACHYLAVLHEIR
jgi:hemolysin III